MPVYAFVSKLLDDNFLLKSMRKPFYHLAANYSVGYCELHVLLDLSKCLQRNSTRPPSQVLPDDVIIKAAEKYERSNYETHSIKFKNEDMLIEDTILKILENVENTLRIEIEKFEVEEKVEELIDTNSLVHILDIKIRGAINKIIQKNLMINLSEIPNLSHFKNIFLDITTYWHSRASQEQKNYQELISTLLKKRKKSIESIRKELREKLVLLSEETKNLVSTEKTELKLVNSLFYLWTQYLWIKIPDSLI